MDVSEFIELVREMRAVQKRWFRGDKSSATLEESKRLERAVDRALAEMGESGQGKLF